MSVAARTALIAALAAAPFLLLGLGAVPFDDPGEGMHAQIASSFLGIEISAFETKHARPWRHAKFRNL